MQDDERLQILDMIATGKVSPQQGIELLKALEEDEDIAGEVQPPLQLEPSQQPGIDTTLPPAAVSQQAALPPEAGSQASPAANESQPEKPPFDPRAKKWQGWWRIPLWIGVIATILTGLLMYSIFRASGFGFWFACSWFPFLISVGILALAWASSRAHWVHIRVQQSPGQRPQRIAISFPVPVTLMAWFLRTFRGKLPGMEGINSDEMILALHHVTPDKPFYVEVNEENGGHVEVYIG